MSSHITAMPRPRSQSEREAAPRLCIMTERQVGIGSAAAALEPHARARPNVVWQNVSYSEPGGLLERLPLPGRSGGVMRGFLQTGEALRQGPFNALLFLTHNPAVFRQLAIARTPTVLWTDVTPALLDTQAEQYEHSVDRSRALRLLKHALVRRTFQSAALCVGWSEWARRSFVADYGVPEERTRVVAPGIDLAHFLPAAGARAGGLPRLLFVGGNFVRKGGDLLLDVFRRNFRGRAELDIVTRDAVNPQADVRVHRGLTAGSSELLELYRNATAFVLPTRGDCFSIAGLEAMAMALPIVISAVGGIPEIVEPGESGFLTAVGDGNELAHAIERLIADPARARRMGERGRAIVESKHDARAVTHRLLELMANVARA